MRWETVVHAKLVSVASESLQGLGVLGIGQVGAGPNLPGLSSPPLLLAILSHWQPGVGRRRGSYWNNA